MNDQRVYNVTINGKNNCAIMTEGELMITKMKHMPNFEMLDMTESHGITPKYVLNIQQQDGWQDGLLRSCGLDKFYG